MSGLVQYILATGGVLAAVGVIGTFIVKCMRGVRRVFTILDAIDGKTQELKHNGGSSMKDALKDAQDKLAQVILRLDRLEKRRFFLR